MAIHVEINGIPCEVAPETTILSAATSLGIEIPTLCYMKELAPDGSCRMCVVEVEGGRKKGLVTACSEHCSDGMKIYTHSDKVKEARHFILDLLMSNHNEHCFSCSQNGACKLQEYCMEYGIEQTSFSGKRVLPGKDSSNPFFTYDPELCIMCRRCERVCEQLQCRDVISIKDRSFDTKMTTMYDIPWSETACESCGNCVSHCPTGALSAKGHQSYRDWETKKVRTTCPHCGTGCQFYLVVKNNKIVGVEPANGPANQNLLCVKGKFGSYKFVHSSDRLTHPLIRKNGVLEKATWDEALDLIASKFKAIQKEYGKDSIAGFSCSRAPNEDNFVFQKMMRTAFGTNNVDNCARVCHSASVTGLSTTLGSGAMTNPIADITSDDIDVILLVGSNPTEAHPVIGTQIRRAVKRGTKLIVVDPRKIDLCDQAELHLPIKPGTNVAFANGMIHIILEEGLADMEYIHSRTEGFEALKEIVKDYTPEKVSNICHIDKDDLRKAALLYAKAKKAPIIYCLGVTEHSSGTEGVMSLSNLAMVVGKIGKPGCGINPLRGQNNVQGACDMGCMPTDFPGYQKISNPSAVDKFEKTWCLPLSRTPGLTSTQVFPAILEDKIKGLYIFGEDPMVTDPDTSHIKKALEHLDFLVVQELFLTETASYADVVLPGVSYAEKDGTFTNTERRIQRVRKAVEPIGEARNDIQIFCDVMTRMGYPCHYESACQVMEEIALLTPSFAGVHYDRLEDANTLQWPCTSREHAGTPILHIDKFTRGIGYFYPAIYKPSKELPDKDYPILLSTGRMLYHYNACAMTGRTEELNEICNESYIEMHESDATKLNIKDGERVKVSSRRGTITTIARVGNKVGKREAFMTFHFQDGNVNQITNAVTDDLAKIPEYKVCAIRIEKL